MNEIDNKSSNSDQNLPQLDYKAIQDVYFRLTSKKETLIRELDIKHKLNMGNVIALGDQLKQWSSIYNVLSTSCAVTVYHENGMKEIYSSIDRFKLYNISHNSPIENIFIEYNLLIQVPDVDQPQSYKASINAHSIEAIKIKSDVDSDFGEFVIQFMPQTTGNIRVEYIDYIVARSLQGVVVDWFKSLDRQKTIKIVELLYNYRKFITPFLRYSLFGLIVAIIYAYASAWESIYFGERYFLGALVAVMLVRVVSDAAYYVGNKASKEAYKINVSSIICINNGDKKLLNEINSNRVIKIIKTISTIVLGVVINLVSALIIGG